MALNFNKPVTTDLMATILTDLRDMFAALVKLDSTTATGLPTGAKRWSDTNGRFETWNGSAWVALQADASTTVRGPVLLTASTSSTSTVLGATASAIKTVYDALVAGFAALNGSNITTGTVPVARLPAASTSVAGISQLSSSTSSTSTALAATASAVKAAYDYAAAGFAALNASNLSSGTVPTARLPAVSVLSGVCTDAQLGLDSAVSGHVRAGNVQILDGSVGSGWTTKTVTSDMAEDTWETYGPTGSGANNIWADLDALPASARILIIKARLSTDPSGTDPGLLTLYAAKGGISPGTPAQAHVAAFLGSDYSVNGEDTTTHQEVHIPLSTSRIFQLRWNLTSGSGSILIDYKGFIAD